MKKVKDCIAEEEYSTALSIMNNVLLSHKGIKEFYNRAIAYYGIGRYYEALQDCNNALDYSSSSYNTEQIYFLRGMCLFQLKNDNAAIKDMKKAGDLGAKFLNDYGYAQTKTPSSVKKKSQSQNPGKNNRATKIIPELKKTK